MLNVNHNLPIFILFIIIFVIGKIVDCKVVILGLEFPVDVPLIASEYIAITNGQGFRSHNMKYCMFVQDNAVKYFDGFRSKELFQVANYPILVSTRSLTRKPFTF